MRFIIADILAFIAEFKRIMIDGDRYMLVLDGLKNTFIITFGALAIGVVIGIVVAAIRTSFDKNKEAMKLRRGVGYYILLVLNAISKLADICYIDDLDMFIYPVHTLINYSLQCNRNY